MLPPTNGTSKEKKKTECSPDPSCQMLELWKRTAALELSRPVYLARALPRETKVQL